jgi:hypothetical protein
MAIKLTRDIVQRTKFFTKKNKRTDEIITVIAPNGLQVGLSGSSGASSGLVVNSNAVFNQGLTGSITKLVDGTSYLVAGTNIALTSGSNGSITIASTSGDDLSFFSSTTIGSIFTTGSVALVGGASLIDAPSDIGTDLFLFVSGAIGSYNTSVTGTSGFGGDLVVSGGAYFCELAESDCDFRVKGNTIDQLLFIDGSEDMVHIGEVSTNMSSVTQGYSLYKDFGATASDPYGFSVDGKMMGDIIYLPTSSITQSNIYYLTDNATVAAADASASATSGPVMLLLAMDNNPNKGMLVSGYARIDSTSLPGPADSKIGDPIYISTTSGKMTYTAPSTTGEVVRIIGYLVRTANAEGSSIIYFKPDNTYIEIT